jgi:diaminopimelate epimerase
MLFTKMHGISNDYVYINGFKEQIEDPAKLSIQLSNRHTGIGSDGIVIILPSATCDFRMRMFNADGSEAEMCGNASRCVGKYVYDKGLTDKQEISLETLAGVKILKLHIKDGKVESVTVDMGEPILDAASIPTSLSEDIIVDYPITVKDKTHHITCVSMGNPHAVIFTENIDSLDLEKEGPLFENYEIFPKRTNTEFVERISRNLFRMRVWERGSGETMACGTGACAVVVAATLNDFCDGKATVQLKGGDLSIEWNKEDNHVYMTGSATTVFEGEIFPGKID